MIYSWAKGARYDFILYVTNRVVSRVPSHWFRLFYYRHFFQFQIDSGTFIHMGAWFDSKSKFHIGKNSTINKECHLDNRGEIKIGDNVSISSEVCILTADHDMNSTDFAGRNRAVIIEDYVFVGTRAMVLPGVTLGKGCVVAAGSVVTKDVQPYAIVAGVPARQIGKRDEDLTYSASYCRLFA